jgi:hypothetical protein
MSLIPSWLLALGLWFLSCYYVEHSSLQLRLYPLAEGCIFLFACLFSSFLSTTARGILLTRKPDQVAISNPWWVTEERSHLFCNNHICLKPYHPHYQWSCAIYFICLLLWIHATSYLAELFYFWNKDKRSYNLITVIFYSTFMCV